MTKVLLISNKSDVTSDFVVKHLKEKRINFYRLNTEEFNKSVSLSINFPSNSHSLYDKNLKQRHELMEFTSVYYRRPEVPYFNQDGLTKGELSFLKNEMLYTLEGVYKLLRSAYWLSPLYSIRQAENKIYQLDIANSLGFKIPNSIVTNSFEKVSTFFKDNNKTCIIKPIKSGLIEDDLESKVVFTNVLKLIPENTKKISSSFNFIQSHIMKKGDIRVIAVGEQLFATFIDSQIHPITQTDWRKGEIKLEHSKIELPSDIQKKCISLLKSLNLKYGAIDFILDKNNNYIFLEINPNGQWAWIERQTGYEITEQIVNLLQYENF